jgi:hypothetical protein
MIMQACHLTKAVGEISMAMSQTMKARHAFSAWRAFDISPIGRR